MKKILLSLSVIVAVGAVVAGATGAFFSDTETSEGNTFTAGAIDLGIDNESYYNGHLNPGTSWVLNYDLDKECPNPFFDPNKDPGEDNPRTIPCLFFNFDDLKPGDWGEDTISLHVNNNDSWLCADVTLTSDKDNTGTEPEMDNEIPYTADDISNNFNGGELAEAVNFYAWADDGDNVYETCEGSPPNGPCKDETLFIAGEHLDLGETTTLPLADFNGNIWGDVGNALPGDSVRFIGKAWCFGESAFAPHPQDGSGNASNNGPVQRPVICDGEGEDNTTQTDSMTVDITFRAEQSRHQPNFTCDPEDVETGEPT